MGLVRDVPGHGVGMATATRMLLRILSSLSSL
jgi:hypothetical protein